MLVTDFIKVLNKIKDKHPNMKVSFCKGKYNGFEVGGYDLIEKNNIPVITLLGRKPSRRRAPRRLSKLLNLLEDINPTYHIGIGKKAVTPDWWEIFEGELWLGAGNSEPVGSLWDHFD